MKNFISVNDVNDLSKLIGEIRAIKKNPFAHSELGKNRTMGLVFLNPSLRTRFSTQKAAMNLGMGVISSNLQNDSWGMEIREGVVMDGKSGEHIKEAARVLSQYCDVIGIRCFPGLQSRAEDYSEPVITGFLKYADVPIVNLESATLHPLQSLADVFTIEENKTVKKPKVVLTWAPHIKALPQAVPNSFAQWINKTDYEFVIAHPKGYDLDPAFSGSATITHNQDDALQGAHFVYAKNWSSYEQYGQILCTDPSWTITAQKMALTDNGKFMHCLPVRRNLKVTDEVLDSKASLVIEEAGNRVHAAQAVLKAILETKNEA
ncbi:MAG: N-acetylornithine carbamoyltransferase [Oligoflexales bacterium]